MIATQIERLRRTRAEVQLSRVFNNIAGWLANVLLIGGAVAVSIAPSTAAAPAIFLSFLAGHSCLAVHSARIRDLSLFVLNATFVVIDAYAVAIRL